MNTMGIRICRHKVKMEEKISLFIQSYKAETWSGNLSKLNVLHDRRQ